jgi:hypothetical protein
MRGISPHAICPDSLNGGRGSLTGTGRLGIALGFRFVHAASVRHLFGWGQAATDIGAPR